MWRLFRTNSALTLTYWVQYYRSLTQRNITRSYANTLYACAQKHIIWAAAIILSNISQMSLTIPDEPFHACADVKTLHSPTFFFVFFNQCFSDTSLFCSNCTNKGRTFCSRSIHHQASTQINRWQLTIDTSSHFSTWEG